jgi:hypothetical protein
MQHSTEDGIGIQDIIRRAWTDSEFKRSLLDNPKDVLEHFLGVTLPSEVTIYVHEETDTEIHLVLPKSSASSTA